MAAWQVATELGGQGVQGRVLAARELSAAARSGCGEIHVTIERHDVDDERWRTACRSATVLFPQGTFHSGGWSLSADA